MWIGALRECTDPEPREPITRPSRQAIIAVTPVHLDMTHHPSVEPLRRQLRPGLTAAGIPMGFCQRVTATGQPGPARLRLPRSARWMR